MTGAEVAFALASALHAGFQLTVTAVVYPALADRSAADWPAAHARHSRAITPLVAVVYLLLAVTGSVLLVSGPDPAGWCAVAGALVAVATTAGLAAPLHGRLGDRDGALVHRLLVVDRWRCLAATAGAVGAVVSLLT